jgi:hypothetical protein
LYCKNLLPPLKTESFAGDERKFLEPLMRFARRLGWNVGLGPILLKKSYVGHMPIF